MTQPRYPLLPLPPLSPACCFLCQRPRDDDGFFDTGADLDFGGRVYICGQCVRELARQLGLGDISVRETELEQRVAGLTMHLENVRVQAAQLRGVLEIGALGLIENVLMEQLRTQLAAGPAQPAGPETEEGEPDAGTEPGPGAAGGDDAGRPADGAGGGGGQPVRRPTRARYRAAPGPDAGDAGGRPGPAAEPAAGPQPAAAGDADQHLTGAPAGA